MLSQRKKKQMEKQNVNISLILCRTCLCLCCKCGKQYTQFRLFALNKNCQQVEYVRLTKEYELYSNTKNICQENIAPSLEFIYALVSRIQSFTDSRLQLGDCACPLPIANLFCPKTQISFSFVHHQQNFKVLMVNFMVEMCRISFIFEFPG